MLSLFLKSCTGFFLLYVAHEVFYLLNNLRVCRDCKIPAIILPLDPLSIEGTILGDPLSLLLSRLPTWLQPACTPYLRRGWFFNYHVHAWKDLGPVWALVTPRDIRVNVADPVGSLEILERRDRRNDGSGFVRPAENYKILAAFGPSLSTADNVNWQRHRKILAPPFNEKVMSDTWNESLEQTKGLIQAWNSIDRVSTVATDLRTLSLNVLAGAGFKKGAKFQSAMMTSKNPRSRDPMSFRDSLQVVMDNVILIMLVPHRYLRKITWSKTCMYIGNAALAFEQHMDKVLDEEQSSVREGSAGAGGLPTALARAMDTKTKSQEPSSTTAITREEACGNMFIVNFAGHDTTANTLTFAALLLTAHPDIQDWISQEVWSVTKDLDSSAWDYSEIFPALQRSRAVMYETLRLFAQVGLLPKATTTQPQAIKLGLGQYAGQEISLPPRSTVNVGIFALQTNAELWGPNALQWDPKRWMNVDKTGQEHWIKPKPGSFLVWSSGPQNCLGAKFSEVEFVAAISLLTASHRLEAVPLQGENAEQTRLRIMSTVEDWDRQVMLKVRKGNAIQIRLTKRSH